MNKMTEEEANKKAEAYCELYEAEEHVADFPDDIAIIRNQVPEIDHLSDVTIARLYSAWSEEDLCAAWLVMKDEPRYFKHFREWLSKEAPYANRQEASFTFNSGA